MSHTADELKARAALRARQGAGARYDADNAPHDDLLLARRGTAYFARKLNELRDAELDGPSLREGWSRRRIVAMVSYRARELARSIAAVRGGDLSAARHLNDDIARAETLPARALRHLFHHAVIHLDVEWRDLTSGQWDENLERANGTTSVLRQTPFDRARDVWFSAIDLANGGRISDIPAQLHYDQASTDDRSRITN